MKKEKLLLQTGDLNSKIWDTHEQSFQAEHLITHPSYNSMSFIVKIFNNVNLITLH